MSHHGRCRSTPLLAVGHPGVALLLGRGQEAARRSEPTGGSVGRSSRSSRSAPSAAASSASAPPIPPRRWTPAARRRARRRTSRSTRRRAPSPSRPGRRGARFHRGSRGRRFREPPMPSSRKRAPARTEGVPRAQYLLAMGATLVSMNSRTVFKTASSSGRGRGRDRKVAVRFRVPRRLRELLLRLRIPVLLTLGGSLETLSTVSPPWRGKGEATLASLRRDLAAARGLSDFEGVFAGGRHDVGLRTPRWGWRTLAEGSRKSWDRMWVSR